MIKESRHCEFAAPAKDMPANALDATFKAIDRNVGLAIDRSLPGRKVNALRLQNRCEA